MVANLSNQKKRKPKEEATGGLFEKSAPKAASLVTASTGDKAPKKPNGKAANAAPLKPETVEAIIGDEPKANVKAESSKESLEAKSESPINANDTAPKELEFEPASDETNSKPKKSSKNSTSYATAQSMASRQREISISEFFTKNRHLLGFDNPAKALLTTVKEAVDNALDACEEAGILPEIRVDVIQKEDDRFVIIVEDNGPGIVKAQIPKIFAKLLYGSKFHRLRQSRGQQGIGISAAVMYSQITTGKPTTIISRTSSKMPAHMFKLKIDTQKNKPVIVDEQDIPEWHKEHGTRIEMEMNATYKRGKQSLEWYLELTAIANPHAKIVYFSPKGESQIYPSVTAERPVEAQEIKPHPYGVELGVFMKMLESTQYKHLSMFFKNDFSRVSSKIAEEICKKGAVSEKASPRTLQPHQIESVYKAITQVKIMAPPTNCLSPIGAEALEKALRDRINAEFYTSGTRPPKVYRGNPFQVEIGLAYGGNLEGDSLATVVRFANRVPLIYQPGACAITKAVLDTNWRNYHLQQSRGALPTGPLYIMAHIASVWVPFTSESKEAIAHYPEIIEEFKLALQECGRRLAVHLARRKREAEEGKKLNYIEKYIPHLTEALQEILGLDEQTRDGATETLKEMLYRSRS